jgi:hypothetical protein
MIVWQTMYLDYYIEAPGQQRHGQGPGGAVEARRHLGAMKIDKRTRVDLGQYGRCAVTQCRVSIQKSIGLYRPKRQRGLIKELLFGPVGRQRVVEHLSVESSFELFVVGRSDLEGM